MSTVLDTSAVLAYLWREPGWERVEAAMAEKDCAIGAANVAEVLAKVLDRGLPEEELQGFLDALDVGQVAMDTQQALESALLRPLTRHLGLSLGDRACLALAKLRRATALTADRPWMQLDLDIGVECIRPGS